MVAGIILLSLGLKKALEYVGNTDQHTLTDALTGIPLAALYGGVALYLLAHVAFLYRMVHWFALGRLVVAVLLLAAIPLLASVPALASLAVLSAVVASMIGYETWRYADYRHEIRHSEQA